MIATAMATGGDDNDDGSGRRVIGRQVWDRCQAGDGPPSVGQASGSQRRQKWEYSRNGNNAGMMIDGKIISKMVK